MNVDPTKKNPWRQILNIGFASIGFVALHMLLLPVRTKILTYILDKSDYGSLTLISTTISLVTLVSSLGSLEFLLRRLPGRDDAYQWSALKTIALWFGGLGAILGLAGVVTFKFFWHPEKLQSVGTGDLVLCAALLVLTIHMTQATHFLMGRSAYAQSRLVQILYADAWFLPIIAIYRWHGPVGITAVLWVWVGWTVLSWVCAQRWVPLAGLARAPASGERLRESLAFGLPLVPMIAGDWLFRAGAFYTMKNPEAVADYGLCFNIAWVGTIVGGAVLDILLTEFFKARSRRPDTTVSGLSADPELRRIFSLMLRYGLVVVIPFGAVLGLANEPVIIFLSDPSKYLNAAPLLPWLVPVPVLFLFIVVFGRTLMAMHRNAVVGWTTLVVAAGNLALCAILVPSMGMKGAALANALTYTVVVLVFGILVRAWRWIDRPALMPVRLVLLTLMSVGGFLALRYAGTGTLATLGLGGAWCGASAFALGLIRRSDFLGFTSTPQSEMSE